MCRFHSRLIFGLILAFGPLLFPLRQPAFAQDCSALQAAADSAVASAYRNLNDQSYRTAMDALDAAITCLDGALSNSGSSRLVVPGLPTPARTVPAPSRSDLQVRLTSSNRWDRNWVQVSGEACNRSSGWTARSVEVSFYYIDPDGLRWTSSHTENFFRIRPGACESFSASLFEVFNIRTVGIDGVSWRWEPE